MQGKQNVLADYRSRYRNAMRKEKATILNEVQFITGYNRKYAIPVLNRPQSPQAILALRETVAAQSPSSGKEPAA
jgi:hypothetical protein